MKNLFWLLWRAAAKKSRRIDRLLYNRSLLILMKFLILIGISYACYISSALSVLQILDPLPI